MNTSMSAQPIPCKHRTHGAHRCKEPQGEILFEDAVAILNECAFVFGVECLRGGNFPPTMTITPASFDALDQRVALTAYVDLINAADEWNFQIGRLRSQIERHVGPINRPFTVVLRGWRYEIVPKVYAS